MQKERQIWIDNTKLVACFLVLLGHFFQSMIGVNVIDKTNLYMWFNQTIYLFHVPLFFICSGYLHQKSGRNKSYKENIIKKFISLGIPYFVFFNSHMGIKKYFLWSG